MNDVKAGDVITVKHEAIGKDYAASGKIELVMVDTGNQPEAFNVMEALSKMKLSKVVKNDVHEDLAEFGVNIGHFSIQQIDAESFTFPEEGIVRVNGEHDVPYAKKMRRPLPDTFFFDVEEAIAIARSLNKQEIEKFERLSVAVERGKVLLATIDKKGYV